MTYTYAIHEPTYADTIYNIESETPLTFEEAYEKAQQAGSVDVEHDFKLEDTPVVINQTIDWAGEIKGIHPTYHALDAFIAKYQLTSLTVVDVVGEGLDVTCWKGDDIIIDIDEDDYDQRTQGIIDVLSDKCGRYTEAGGTITPDDDGSYRFEGNVTKRVIL